VKQVAAVCFCCHLWSLGCLHRPCFFVAVFLGGFLQCLGDRQLADSEEMFAVSDKKIFGPKKRVTSLRAPLISPNMAFPYFNIQYFSISIFATRITKHSVYQSEGEIGFPFLRTHLHILSSLLTNCPSRYTCVRWMFLIIMPHCAILSAPQDRNREL